MLTCDRNGRIVEAGCDIAALLGYGRHELIGLTIDQLDARGVDGLFAGLHGRLRGRRAVAEEVALRHRDGHVVKVWLAARLRGWRGGGLVDLALEPLAAHEACALAGEHYASMVQSTSDYVFAKDLGGRFVEVNHAFLNALGLPASKVIGRTDADLFAAEAAVEATARDHLVQLCGHTLEDECSLMLGERRRDLVVRRSPWRDDAGRVIGTLGVATDVTALRKIQGEREALLRDLQQANLRLQRVLEEQTRLTRRAGVLLETGRELLAELATDRLEAIAARALERSLDGAAGAVAAIDSTGTTWSIRAYGERGAACFPAGRTFVSRQTTFADAVLGGESVARRRLKAVESDVEADLARHGMAAMVAVPIRADEFTSGALLVAWSTEHGPLPEELWFLEHLALQLALALRNAAMHERAQDSVRSLQTLQMHASQAGRLRALGQLASGVAHDFNNALTTILGFTEWLLHDSPGDIPARADLETIRTAAQDAAAMVRRLQLFGRRGDSQDVPMPVDLAAVARTLPQLTRPRADELALERHARYEITVQIDAEPLVLAIESEIRELLVNLVFNALDATPGDGVVTVGVRVTDGRPQLWVADEGTGMTEQVQARIFEPFFSTKESKGCGLGLSVCWSLAERCGAQIAVESAVGRGSTFRVHFPAAAAFPGPSPPPEEGVGLGLSIIVVDDHGDVCDSVADMLAALGHRATTTSGGEAALAAFDREPADLVITDLAMPGMNGLDLARALRARDPDVPVMLLTGWGLGLDESCPSGITLVVRKPVTLKDLHSAVARTAASRRPFGRTQGVAVDLPGEATPC